jgi:hypothetical protein
LAGALLSHHGDTEGCYASIGLDIRTSNQLLHGGACHRMQAVQGQASLEQIYETCYAVRKFCISERSCHNAKGSGRKCPERHAEALGDLAHWASRQWYLLLKKILRLKLGCVLSCCGKFAKMYALTSQSCSVTYPSWHIDKVNCYLGTSIMQMTKHKGAAQQTEGTP